MLDIKPRHHLTIEQVSLELRVSSASVRNWIKTGYLEAVDGFKIPRKSFEVFKSSVVGTEKLTKRANKSNFDQHDHCSVQAKFLALAGQSIGTSLDSLGTAYEAALSNSHRNKEGIYYTSDTIVQDFFDFIEGDVSKLVFCDPCCGSGNFIVAALKRGFLPENVYGFDTDPVAVEIAKNRFKEKTGAISANILVADFLQDIVLRKITNVPSFDIVLTNPPWGKKIQRQKKEEFSSAFGCSKSTDTAALFFRAALNVSTENAVVGMLLPESFFNISTFHSTRKIAAQHNILGLIDFGKPFKGLLTKAKGIVLRKGGLEKDHTIRCKTLVGEHSRSQTSFISNPKFIFNFNYSEENADIIQHLYTLPHIKLEGQAKWGLGIVTGNNKKFVKDRPIEGYIPVFKGAEIQPGTLSEPSNFIPSDLSLYQQVAPNDLYFSTEKLIYRFISSKLVFHHDTQSKLFLNSASMLILNHSCGISHENLAWLLNTNIMNWLFKVTFDTHKILRSDLETLPIFSDFFNKSHNITEEDLLEYLNLKETVDGTYRIKR